MAAAVLVSAGARLLFLPADNAPPVSAAWGSDPTQAAERWISRGRGSFPEPVAEVLRQLPGGGTVETEDELMAAGVRRLGRNAALASVETLRQVRASRSVRDPREERAFLREVARLSLEAASRRPEEMLIALAREEERVERSLGRDANAAAAFVGVPETPLARHAARWERFRQQARAFHGELAQEVDELATAVAPNLSAVVGPRVAARLIAAAGTPTALARMSASRLQLLGVRRRPSPVRGPRFGILFRAERMAEVPVARRGAYARSLASLAVIAARADAVTHRSIAPGLVHRRDRRVQELQRGRR